MNGSTMPAEPYIPPTKKSFSLKALAFWGERLAQTPAGQWESGFSACEIELGRRLYRSEHVAEIILGERDAVVVFRTGDKNRPLYLVLDVGNAVDGSVSSSPRVAAGTLLPHHWRSSIDSREKAAPFAVAAFYIVEEFVAAEYANLPLSIETNAGKFSSAGTLLAKENATTHAEKPAEPPPARKLCVVFSSGENELSFTARWKGTRESGESGKEPNALVAESGGNAEKTAQGALLPKEREQMLRLAALARKAGFSFVPERGAYLLAGTPLAVRFANEYFPAWQKRFEIEGGQTVAVFSRSAREIDARMRLFSESKNSFGLRWVFSLDGEKFSEEETRSLLRHRGEPVFLPGRGVVRLSEKARRCADDWPDSSAHGLPIYTLLSLFRDNDANALVPDAKLRAWRKNFLREPQPVDGLPAFLRPYQARGVAWMRQMFLRGAHPLLADEMGLGKTRQAIALLALDLSPKRPALVVCPASVIPVWKNEIRSCFPQLSVRVLGIDGDFSRRKNAGTPPHLWLASYGMLRAHADKLSRRRFSYAVLDEAQFIKNPQAKMTQACLKILADRRLALTGTPIENRHLDLWSVFRFLMPGLLGRRTTLETELEADDAGTVEKMRAQIAPFILRRTKQDVARELPEKVNAILHCPLTQIQRERYEKIATEGIAALRNASGGAGTPTPSDAWAKNPTHFLTLLMRLRQAACDPALLPREAALPTEFSGKISVLLERLEEIIDNGGKVVVFSQFVSLLERVRGAIGQRFGETPIFILTGKTLDRATPVKNFQAHTGAAVFLVSLRAGGTGLTLNSAEYVFLLDPWWNPAVEEQAIDRVHRIGQTRRVFVYRMVAAGTIEERIERLKQTKRKLFDTLVGELPDMSDWASHYSSMESLISLSE